jgi:hypothetical protein
MKTRLLAIAAISLAQLLAPSAAHAATPASNVLYEMERDFYRLKIPTGKIDGVIDGKTQRALCVWREMTNRPINRKLPTTADIQAIAMTEGIFVTTSMQLGLNINLRCQAAVWVREDLETPYKIFPVSSGRPGFETIRGTYNVGWLIDDWYESRTYPEGWMYRPQFFNKGQAIHGSLDDSMVQTYPASHGCVRMIQKDIDYLWDNGFGKNSLIHIYGTWIG